MMNIGFRKLTGLAAIVAVMAIVVAACGGGDEAPTAAPAPTQTPRPAVTTAPTSVPTAAPTATATRPAPTATAAPAATPAGPQPKTGGTLQARLPRDVPAWDTYHATHATHVAQYVQQFLSNLIRFQRDSLGKIEGDTAESWTVSSDGKTITFKLRNNVKWHDGKPFTSADVLYNFQRASAPAPFTFNRDRVAPIASMETPDASTFRVTLKKVSASFLPNIAGPFMLMYPAHITDMAEWQKTAVGTGAFALRELKANTSILYTKNPAYYGKDAAGRQLPYLDGVNYTILADPALALSAFRTGRTQCGCYNDADYLTEAYEALKREIPGVNLVLRNTSAHQLQFNMTRAPFNNAAFRQAVAIGFDKEKVASVFTVGLNFRPAPPLVPPENGGQWGLSKAELSQIPGYNPDHAKDLAIAQQKFRESGIDPKTVELELVYSTFFGPLGDLMATVLSELGMKVKASALAAADLGKRRLDGAFDLSHHTPGFSLDDPSDQYSSIVITGGLTNFGKYSNSRMDQLLEAQDAELDTAKRRALLVEVQRIHLSEFPTAPFFWSANVRGSRPEVRGHLVPLLSITSAHRLEGVWLER